MPQRNGLTTPSTLILECAEFGTVTDNVNLEGGGPCRCPNFGVSFRSLLGDVSAFRRHPVPVAHGQTLASTASFSGSVSDSIRSAGTQCQRHVKQPREGNHAGIQDRCRRQFLLRAAAGWNLYPDGGGGRFQDLQANGITLEVGQSASQSITLTIGSVEQIEVTCRRPLCCRWTTPTSAPKFLTKQVTELPLNLRNVFNFVELNSSVNNLSQRQTISSGGQQGSADQDVSFFNFGGGLLWNDGIPPGRRVGRERGLGRSYLRSIT